MEMLDEWRDGWSATGERMYDGNATASIRDEPDRDLPGLPHEQG